MESNIDHYIQLCSRLTLQNKSLGFFKDLLDKIVPFTNIGEFSRCETDFQRVAYCAQHFWYLIGAELIFRGKDNNDGVAKRLEGNIAFGNRDFEKALLLFSQGIIKSPAGKDLALCYANRSAALQKLKEFQLAINDIELAFSYDYPDESRHKLYERMAACQLKLKNYAQAKVVVGICKHYLAKYEISESEGFHEKLAKHLKQLEAQGSIESQKRKEDCSNGDGIPNEMFPGTSSKFRVGYSPENGRFAYAEDMVLPGETVLREEPFAKALLVERMGTHCLHCFKRLRAAVACEVCANVAYCSKACRQAADNYHQFEYRVLSLLIGSGMTVLPHLALRMVTQTTADKIIFEFDGFRSTPDTVTLNTERRYNPTLYESVWNLSALENQREPLDFLERTIMAIFLLKCLRLVGYFNINLFKHPDPTPDEIKVGAVILRNLQILQFNAYEITEFIADNKALNKATTLNIGLGLYPTAAFFNHSCTPNVTRYFSGSTMTVVSTQRIKGQICDNYGPLFTKIGLKARKFKLEGRYWFRCSCQACLNDWPTYEAMTSEIHPTNEQEKCALAKLQELDDMFYGDGLQSMENGDISKAITTFTKYLNESSLLLNSMNSLGSYRTFHLVQDAFKLCIQATGS